MTGFTVTRKARDDLIAIGRFTQARWGKHQRNLYLKQLDDAFKLLAEKPGAGRDCSEIRPGYRKFPVGSHVVFYKPEEEGHVVVVRVLHESMDVESTL